MQVEIKEQIEGLVVEGDLVVMRWTHQPYEWVGQITKTSASDNAYLHGLDGKSQYYRNRGFKTVADLVQHLHTSRSVRELKFLPKATHKLQVVAKGVN
ncbi:TPA: hypothetical protein ACLBZX_005177 [Bacillus cereus]|uniref:hypothetical protein n=1 Tax=Bacillus cereus group TaxID=86661 RepID=UPI000BA29671|nr:hypothetical protein [Bacillus thuringiensis]